LLFHALESFGLSAMARSKQVIASGPRFRASNAAPLFNQIPVRVRECAPPGLLKPIVYIDLVGLSVAAAQAKFLAGVRACLNGKSQLSSPKTVPAVEAKSAAIYQSIRGDDNVVVGGDFVMYKNPPKQKIIVERRAGTISTSQIRQIQSWIEKLVEGTVGLRRERAFAMWWGRFKNHFGVAKYDDLSLAEFPNAEIWFIQQSTILVRKLKTKAPDAWRHARFGSIHNAIARMGIEKLEYYSQAAQRLKIQPFTSLKQLTKRDLDRVYSLAMRDAKVC
jgi:hypothetical protein